MSVRNNSRDQIADTLNSSFAGGSRLLHPAVVASTSLIAMSAALGWNSPALAVGTCGAPVGGVANCSATAYPAGIEYLGANAVDDLTVNVGSFAGQTGSVTVGGPGIQVADTFGLNSLSETVNVGSNVAISTTGYTDIGVLSQAYATSVATTVYNAGALTSTGYSGIVAQSIGIYEGVYEGGSGVLASSAATVSVDNLGSISAYGLGIVALSQSVAFGANDAYANATSSVVNSGDISTSIGAAIYTSATAYSLGDTQSYATSVATASNGGALVTTGDYANGMDTGAASDAEVTGAVLQSYATASSSVSAVNTGSIQTGGTDSVGMLGVSQAEAGAYSSPLYGNATAVLNLTNAGSIKTTGGPDAGGYGADGIYGFAGALGRGLLGGTGTATINVTNAGSIWTSGDKAQGVGVYGRGVGVSLYYATGAAYANVVNTGIIGTKGVAAPGISAKAVGYAVTYYGQAGAYSGASATNTGSIATRRSASDGISVVANAKAVGVYEGTVASAAATANATNTGRIKTKGDGSSGIYALAGDTATGFEAAPYASTTVVNTGDIATSGAGSLGIAAISSGYAETRYVYSTTRTSVTNAGAITTAGAGSVGIYALSQSQTASPATLSYAGEGKNYASSAVTNAGTVTTSGDYAPAVVALATATAFSVYQSRTYAYGTVTNVGAVKTTGKGSTGIQAVALAGAYQATTYYSSKSISTTKIVNAGSVTTSGDGASGIVGISSAVADGGSSASAISSVSLTNAGAVSVSGPGGIGLEGESAAYAASVGTSTASATALVVNLGSVVVTGDGGVGVEAAAMATVNGAVAPGTSTVVNAGAIVASGAGGIGVVAEGAYSTVLTYSGSSIKGGTGAGASGVYTNAAEGIVANGGAIGSGNDAAIVMSGVYANIIQNTGTITGFVTLHGTGPTSQNVFYNYGTWIARGGNSDFAHGAAGGSNLVDEPTGKIVVVGNQSFTNLDTFTNLDGLVTMTQAASFGLGTRPAFETLTISGDYDGVAGNLAVDASTVGGMQGDVFKIDGTASGITDVHATILGTPGATTGNGVLLVEANGVTGAGNFVLAGNANSGHSLVDGAFEYNLAFVPGGGAAGDWYLQSTIYPGLYQFGQIGSSTTLVADSVNPSVDDLLNQALNGSVKSASLDDLSQQVASTDNSFVPAANGPGMSGWGRFDESRFNVEPSGSSFANYKLRVDSVQLGADYDWHNATNNVMVGGYITPFRAWSDFSQLGGHIGTSGTAYGVYGLWFSGPWQAGLRLNYDDNTAHISDTFIGTSASIKPTEKGIQAAASYDMPMDWADFTPSAELNYGTVAGVQFADGAGDVVGVGTTNDFWGKLNGRFSWDVTTAHGLLVQPYFNVGLLYRGDSSTKVTVSGFPTSTNINGYNGDFAVGVNTNLAAGLSLSAQADYVAGNRVEGWTGFIGLRYTPGAVEAPQPAPPPPAPPPPPPPPPPTKTFIVFFDFNKSNLTAEAQSVVAEAVKTAKANGMVRVLVTGHTDTVGSDSYNMGLSVRRAQSVKDEMVREGIDGSGISIEGKGFHDPLVPTGPGVREPQNRRAVIDLGG